MDGDSQIDKIIGVVIAALIGLILIVRAFLPIAADQIADISSIPEIGSISGGSSTITGLLSVVVTIVIISLVVSVIKMLRDRD